MKKLLLVSSLCIIFIIMNLNISASEKPDGVNWMKYCSNSIKLSDITIPGTHDSGSMTNGLGPSDSAKTQDLTISQQLEVGVRYLDIRCRHKSNKFYIHHGMVYQNQTFEQVLDTVITFLNSHPTETVIMCVKEEYTPENNSRSFSDTFNWYVNSYKSSKSLKNKTPSSYWYKSSGIPLMGNARGKIVLINRFGGVNWGIDASSVWPNNDTCHRGDKALWIQDVYHQENTTDSQGIAKWNAMQELIHVKKITGILYINYASGYAWKIKDVWPNITTVSSIVNPKIESYFGTKHVGESPYGIIACDHISKNIAQILYMQNF